ncbi:MAG: hypothetical protein M3Q07_27675 [Pseudobdellovibrionaceae bacterium]|nr:hypothetical protein [Pseudobdellovibrionaceae bacterium]
MMFQALQRMVGLFVVTWVGIANSAAAQTQIATPLPVIKQTDIARADRRPAKSSGKAESFTSEKKKSKNFSYSYLLPFGVGQFERGKTILGTTLATTQAGFLLMFFERSNAVRSSNADAADVMRGVDLSTVGNDPAMVAFLDQNEQFTLKAQQQQNLAIAGFFALYTLGVVEAVFDPLAKFGLTGNSGSSSKKKRKTAGDVPTSEGTSRLVQDLKEEQQETKVGLFYQPDGSGGAVGLSLHKPL